MLRTGSCERVKNGYIPGVVKLYVKNWCPWCIDAERWLAGRGHVFEKVDVLKDADSYQTMRRISGQSLTPTLEMPDGRVLADFGVEELEGFLSGKTSR